MPVNWFTCLTGKDLVRVQIRRKDKTFHLIERPYEHFQPQFCIKELVLFAYMKFYKPEHILNSVQADSGKSDFEFIVNPLGNLNFCNSILLRDFYMISSS